MKNIVVGSYLPWNSERGKVGIHAIGEHFLTKGCHIEWIAEPISPLSLARPVRLGWKLGKIAQSLRGPLEYTSGESTLVSRLPLVLLRPFRWVPFLNSHFVARNYWGLALTGLPPYARKPDSSIDLLMFDAGGSGIFPLLAAKARLVVYRLNDLVAEFPRESKGRIECEAEILQKADIILAASESLYAKAINKRGRAEGVYLLPNGVDVDLFWQSFPEPQEYRSIPRPRAVFVGGLPVWFDWELLTAVARHRKDFSFCIVGEGDYYPADLPNNVYLLGARPHQQIPPYLQHADVGLIPFKNMPRIRSVERPLKFYEYIASGLPVVTVPYGNMKKMSPPALLAGTSDEFARALDLALEHSAEAKSQLRQEARRYSWQRIFEQLDHILSVHGFDFGNDQ